jgi:Meckel syndrome type 1 protein
VQTRINGPSRPAPRRAAPLSLLTAGAALLFALGSCHTMRRTVAVLVTPTPGAASVVPPRATAPPPVAPAAPPPTAALAAPSPTATALPVRTAPVSVYEETPGVVYERTLAAPVATQTPFPSRRTPTRKPGVYYEDDTPTPTSTPRG